MKFQLKPKQVEAYQWFKNGDHPNDYTSNQAGFQNGRLTTISTSHRKAHDWEGEVVRRFNHPGVPSDQKCNICNHTMQEHGWVDQAGSIEYSVCPGDWVITEENGYSVCDQKTFFDQFEQVHPTRSNKTTLGTIVYHNDDDTGIYRIGEVDGGWHTFEVEQYIKQFGVNELLIKLGYLQHYAILIHQQLQHNNIGRACKSD